MADFLMGTNPSIQQAPIRSKAQIKTMRDLLEEGKQIQRNPYEGFQPIAAQARSNFYEGAIPQLLERLTGGMGGGGSLSSPTLSALLGQSAGGFEQGLAAQQAQFGQQNRDFGLRQLGMGLQPEFQNFQIPGQAGFGEEVLPSLLKFAPLLLGLIPGVGTAAGGAAGVGELLRLLLSSGAK